MQFPDFTYFVVGAGLLILAVAIVRRLGRKAKNSEVSRKQSRGPADLRYTCARCSSQETHSKRTLSAWESGSRKFFCNSCHSHWREAQPPRAQQSQPTSPSTRNSGPNTSDSLRYKRSPVQRALAPTRSGCLTVLLVLAIIPTAIIVLNSYA